MKRIINIKRIDRYITIAVILVMMVLIYFFADPSGNLMHFQCIHKTILGFECPLCGSTRATYELMHLNIRNAWLLNPAIFSLALFFVFETLNITLGFSFDKYRKYFLGLVILSFTILYVIRIIVATV